VRVSKSRSWAYGKEGKRKPANPKELERNGNLGNRSDHHERKGYPRTGVRVRTGPESRKAGEIMGLRIRLSTKKRRHTRKEQGMLGKADEDHNQRIRTL